MKNLRQRNFYLNQGVYIGDVDTVQCILAAQALAKEFPWFAPCAERLEMLRIDEITDLTPVVGHTEEKEEADGLPRTYAR